MRGRTQINLTTAGHHKKKRPPFFVAVFVSAFQKWCHASLWRRLRFNLPELMLCFASAAVYGCSAHLCYGWVQSNTTTTPTIATTTPTSSSCVDQNSAAAAAAATGSSIRFSVQVAKNDWFFVRFRHQRLQWQQQDFFTVNERGRG